MIGLSSYCTVLDYRANPVEELEHLLVSHLKTAETPSLLWQAKRPKKRWFQGLSDWSPLVLSSAPAFEQILWLHPNLTPMPPLDFQEECSKLLEDYAGLFEGSSEIETCPKWQSYRELLLRHVKVQQENVFPQLLEKLPVDRATRELGYEHQGLLKNLETLKEAVRSARAGQLERRLREKIDLDFYHLLEHHIERETEALLPAIVFLEGVYRPESTCYNPAHRVVPT